MPDQAIFITRVAVNSPLRHSFDYSIPQKILDTLPKPYSLLGCRVIVPFGRRLVTGIIIECPEHSDIVQDQLKPIKQIVDHQWIGH